MGKSFNPCMPPFSIWKMEFILCIHKLLVGIKLLRLIKFLGKSCYKVNVQEGVLSLLLLLLQQSTVVKSMKYETAVTGIQQWLCHLLIVFGGKKLCFLYLGLGNKNDNLIALSRKFLWGLCEPAHKALGTVSHILKS